MNPAPRDAVHKLALQHFAFLLDRGFVADPEEKARRRFLAEGVRYRGEHWRVDLDLEYRDGWYVVWLVPLVDGKARQVPFGYTTRYELLQYLPKYLGIEDEEVAHLQEYRSRAWPAEELLSVEHANEILEGNARLLARYLDQIVASPHPPVGRE